MKKNVFGIINKRMVMLAAGLCLGGMLLVGSARAQSRQVLLHTTEGDIRISLSDLTPLHRDNFIKLVNEHFYDSLLFHRVIKGFMIQAGDPNSRHAEPGAMLGDGDTDYTLQPEFRTPQLYHRRGVVAMAREGDEVNPARRSSGCQFYIVWGKTFSSLELEKMQVRLDSMTHHEVTITPEMFQAYKRIGGTPHLDGQYTVFGEVVAGLDVVERIQRVFTDDYDRPVDDVRILSATVLTP
jgi:peptidyl-prolyl cis-trans isomerase B (cyclophilin B)